MKEPFGHGSIRRAGTRWLLDAYGSTSFGQTFTGLATSNVGGVGFLEQTIPDT